eukprot:TRINITY_DN2001_c0_g1_i2.p1 TRINITY_DN2001_c0_g1~~TRINITY_DN2001_c0_g1_i2.p1  ORF type:complete len:241 (-),score=33.76 TRINITY_DN2001_c0_g1_i2:483-1205(-)
MCCTNSSCTISPCIAEHVTGYSQARLRSRFREAAHMFFSPLSGSYVAESRCNRHKLEMHVRREIGGNWEIRKVAEQFLNRILSDWKYNTHREAKNMLLGRRPTDYVPRSVSDVVWTEIVDIEKKKLSGEVPKSQQQLLVDSKAVNPLCGPPNCLGAGGRAKFRKRFVERYGRQATEEEIEYFRKHAGKQHEKLERFWQEQQVGIAEGAAEPQMTKTSDLWKDLVMSDYSKKESDGELHLN